MYLKKNDRNNFMLKPKHLIVLTQIIMLFACDTTETNTRKVTPGNKPNIEILQITPPVKSNLKITDTITIKCKFELKDIEPGNEYEIEMVFEPENYIYEGLASTLAYIGLGYPGIAPKKWTRD